jgi:ElaA protein
MSFHWQTTDFEHLGVDGLYAVLHLRQAVFVVEQACLYQDLDGLDRPATHMLCWEGNELAAYQRCLPPGTSFRESAIGRIVVAPSHRHSGLGQALVERGIRHNLARWPESGIRINAQAYLRAFYSRLGFEPAGDEYDEDGIPHLQMVYRPLITT